MTWRGRGISGGSKAGQTWQNASRMRMVNSDPSSPKFRIISNPEKKTVGVLLVISLIFSKYSNMNKRTTPVKRGQILG
jgi:hypothetical protein